MPTYGIHKPIGLKFLTRLRLGPIHLNEHKLKHNFKDCVNPLCSFSLDIESYHFFLNCHYFTNTRATLFEDLKSIDLNFPSFPDSEIVGLLLYGSPKFDFNQNNKILSSSIGMGRVVWGN